VIVRTEVPVNDEGVKGMNRWGRCARCARWFYMPASDDVCPVCANRPRVVVDRDADSDAPAHATEDEQELGSMS
jgi:rRNA maturation endonuclease Nob1